MREFLSTQTGSAIRVDEQLEQAAQSLTALLRCKSCSFYASDCEELVLEIELTGSSWVH
jgi:hypothetical protein